ncbi:MAG: peptidylprolyl isomerase [Saccharospirillaceae bacterium]|nr:peptidylprolyl isomerase [Pseudomonadales bacterium]NRB80474.1 peptidylprolyl isomerase [Saccharospirillaceae bacterium]
MIKQKLSDRFKSKLIHKVIGAVSLICVSLSTIAQVQWVDQTEVIVNDEVILRSDVEAALIEKKALLISQNQANLLLDASALRKTVTEELIEHSILTQRAKRIGVNVSDQMLNEEISGIAARNNMDLTEFVNAIEQQGQDYIRYRENIREQIMIQMLVRYEVGNRIRVSDAQTDRLLTAQRTNKITDPEYKILHKRFESVEQAEEYLAALNENGLKDDSSATDLGYRKTSTLPQLFVANLDMLDDRQISKVIERSGSFHIIQVIDIKGDAKQSVTQHFARHILIMPNELRDKQQALELATQLHKRAVDGEDFGQLATTYSDDEGSAALNGELGWTDGSEMVVVFRETLPQVEINEISKVFETQYGYHFLQVTKRRQKDLYDENLRNLAKQKIGDKAYKEEYPRWLADLKLSAYIKYSNESDVEFQLNRIKDDK